MLKRNVRKQRHYTLPQLREGLRGFLMEVCGTSEHVDKFFGRIRGFEEGYRHGLSLPEIMVELFPKAGKVKGTLKQHRGPSVATLFDKCKKKRFIFPLFPRIF
jgi:hypothetical protein